jgi:drug/metabolite transporter (DMT)-like permease
VTLPGPATFAALVAFSAACAMFVYWHADRHASRHPTAWGVAAFLAPAIVLAAYFLQFWMRRRR